MAGKGPLVRVHLGRGRYVKMYREDAERQGYLQPKARRGAEDKLRAPEGDKGAQTPRAQTPGAQTPGAQTHETEEENLPGCGGVGEAPRKEADDLTEIPGVGEATARALEARGIRAFAELRTASLEGLPGRIRAAIEAWREA